MSIDALMARVRPELRELRPYSSARMEANVAGIHLDANESPLDPAGDAGVGLNRYPQPQPDALLSALAGLYGVAKDQLLVGRGSDEAIDLLTRAFCRAGVDSVLICPPTFGMYAVCARIQGARVLSVALDPVCDFQPDVEALVACLRRERPRLLYLCSPNNPSGGLIPRPALETLLDAAAETSLVVVDEAYAEYSAAPSMAAELGRWPHLAVLRTLSKAWGLAGARLGCLLAAPQLINLLRGLMAPYPLPTPSVDAALRALAPAAQAVARQRMATVLAERERVAAQLAGMPGVLRVWPSQANFLAFQVAAATPCYAALRQRGVIIRNISHYPGMAECLRVSIGTRQENDAFLSTLALCLTEVA